MDDGGRAVLDLRHSLARVERGIRPATPHPEAMAEAGRGGGALGLLRRGQRSGPVLASPAHSGAIATRILYNGRPIKDAVRTHRTDEQDELGVPHDTSTKAGH